MAETDPNTVSEKTCKRCNETKTVEAFSRVTRRIGGRDHTCKTCRNAARSPEARARSRAATKAWMRREHERFREIKRAECERRRRRLGMRKLAEISAEGATRRASAHQTTVARREQNLRDRIEAKPWSDPALTKAQSFALRYKLDADFNLKQRLRAAERRRQRGLKISEHIRGALCRDGESGVVLRTLGYTVAQLRRHLERQFTDGMTWARFTAGDIHIDHRRPLASFDLADPNEWRHAWALSNLQPLWAPDNLAKGARLTLLL